MNKKVSRCGMIALVGRPNVGKSTLLNSILGEKLCITSRKPQTTRHRILGIHTVENVQAIYVDTPGLHKEGKKMMNRLMNQAAITSFHDVDVIGFVVEALKFKPEDEFVLQQIVSAEVPCVLIINKVDLLADKNQLLPFLEKMQALHDFAAMVPVSAKSGEQVQRLEEVIQTFLPIADPIYPPDQLTDRSVRFLCAELIREKIFRLCGQELPYSTTVEIEAYDEGEKLDRICALIIVEKESHKRMIVGEKGQKLKRIASEARVEMEALIGKKVFLQCYCKVKSGWRDEKQLLKQFGYGNS